MGVRGIKKGKRRHKRVFVQLEAGKD